MPTTSIDKTEVVRQLLQSTDLSRDALPFTDEFERLYDSYLAQTGESVSRHEVWRHLSNAAKRGGMKGKQRGEPAPDLSQQEQDIIRTLFCGKLGSRDCLPYTDEFSTNLQRFNDQTGQQLSERELWRALGNVGKASHHPDIDRLLQQAIDSLVLAVEHFNRPSNCGRQVSVLLMLDHAFEMFLKASLLHRGEDIRNPKTGYCHSFDFCLNKVTDEGSIRYLSDDERRTLKVLNGLRDQAQHYLVDVSEQFLYTVAQGAVTLFAEILTRVFGRPLADDLPDRVLPVSTNPPRDIQVLMDDEFSQLKSMLQQGKANAAVSEARLRSLLTIDRALKSEEAQVSDSELAEISSSILTQSSWNQVFHGIAQVNLTTDGAGINVALHITKKEGVPMRIAQPGESAEVVAIRKVNDTDFYCLNATQLAERVGLNQRKTLALVHFLKIQSDPDCFKLIKLGGSPFKMYSQHAALKIQESLPETDLESVCQLYSASLKRKPR